MQTFMKKYFILPALALVLLAFGCKEDAPLDNTLRLDGENQSGPLLEAGAYELAVRFTPQQTAKFAGRQLESVQWYNGPRAATTILKVYSEGTPGEPGSLLYSATVTSQVKSFTWNEHKLTTPVDIPDGDLWISLAITHSDVQQSIGCDAGPNKSGGDWLFKSADGLWDTYLDRTGESVNWNIRGIVSE